MGKSQSDIVNYFNEYIYGYVYNDIQNCINARANYTVALSLLSYTEYLGGLIDGSLGLRNGNGSRFEEGLKYFDWNGDTKYYVNFTQKYLNFDKVIKVGKIYDIFRCGLAHEYFIKGDSFVHNNPNGFTDNSGIFHPEGCVNDDAGVQIVGDISARRLRFHTNAYYRDFKNAFNKYFAKLTIEKNPKLITNFSEALDRIEARKLIL